MKNNRLLLQTHRVVPACLLVGGLLLLLAPAADAQGYGRGGGAAQADRPILALQFARQLELTDAQVRQLTALQQELRAEGEAFRLQMRETVQGLRSEDPDLTREEIREDPQVAALLQQRKEMRKAHREKIESVLTAEQIEELNSIRQTCGGPRHKGYGRGQGRGFRHGRGGGFGPGPEDPAG